VGSIESSSAMGHSYFSRKGDDTYNSRSILNVIADAILTENTNLWETKWLSVLFNPAMSDELEVLTKTSYLFDKSTPT
jgi:hypothetical protein